MIDLVGELAAARAAITDGERDALLEAGIPQRAIEIVGAARIDLDRSARTYQLLEDIGDRVFILGVRAGDTWTPERLCPDAIAYCGPLVDLLAWHPRAVDHWALRLDTATWLGAIPPQFMNPAPVSIRRSPLGWLRAGAAGLCILTHDDREARALLRLCHRIEAEDDAHADELRHLLERPLSVPPITVARKPSQARAA